MRIVDCEQHSVEWWMARRGIPTASEFASIITPKQWKPSAGNAYLCQLIADKFRFDYPNLDAYQSKSMRNGTSMEPIARAWYDFDRGVEVRQVGFCLSDCGR